MHILLSAALAASLLLLGCTANVEPRRTSEAPLPALVAQRVTATIQREAPRLVRLETEHEPFLTTPEHPFATPRSGWVPAGRLVPGDWVVSARFGAVRLLSVRSEPAARPVPVFNLSVASSHAYFVGTDRVLVHNTKCKRERRKKDPEVRDREIADAIRARDALDLKIEALKRTDPNSPEIAKLKANRDKLYMRIHNLSTKQRKIRGEAALRRGRQLNLPEIQREYTSVSETARAGLEAAQKELDDLENRQPNTERESVEIADRRGELVKTISELTLDYTRANQILIWLRELAELEKSTPATDAERRTLEEKKKKLHDDLKVERSRARALKHARAGRADPESRDKANKYHRSLRDRLLRTPAYLADTERDRDALELAEAELADLRQQPPSERRDARILHLTELLEVMNKVVDLRRERARAVGRRRDARRAREELAATGGDTRKLDEKLLKVDAELRALRIEIAQLRLRERLLTRRDGTPSGGAAEPLDAELLEFLRQLSDEMVTDQRLAEIERALDAMDPTDADWEQTVLVEADDVDEALRDWENLVDERPSAERPSAERPSAERPSPERPSPERAAALQSGFERLQRELREEREAIEGALTALINESASLQANQASSSSGPTWLERLYANEQTQLHLRAQWQKRLRTRLNSAQQRLTLRRRVAALHNEAVEVELVREITLLEQELRFAGG